MGLSAPVEAAVQPAVAVVACLVNKLSVNSKMGVIGMSENRMSETKLREQQESAASAVECGRSTAHLAWKIVRLARWGSPPPRYLLLSTTSAATSESQECRAWGAESTNEFCLIGVSFDF